MEISLVSPGSLRLKGKNASLVIDPNSSIKNKIPADGVVLLAEEGGYDLSKIENSRLIIKGPGEYEIGRIKIISIAFGSDLVYSFFVDNVRVFVAKSEVLEKNSQKLKENFSDTQILVLNANALIDQAKIADLTPQIVVLYGEKASEIAKSLGKEKENVAKLSITADKLPQEMEVVVLG